MKYPVLVLNSSYLPVTIFTWKKAFKAILNGNAYLVHTYKKDIKGAKEYFKRPCVIALKRHVNSFIKSPQVNRELIFIRDNNTCGYCGYELAAKERTLDHIVPKSKGGKSSWKNLITCCFGCNNLKGGLDLKDFEKNLLFQPFTPIWPIIKDVPLDWKFYLI